ncbi:helix-turn-helix transcriptional regulator [Microbacterium dauci]|uniref:DNA-binding protein n=1 Tax=Microbacterium dauci TaxID=3048008 RepID=A0ABT6ZHW0_9MICO|nr:DNA-binding protein [Microbacterium sp. LX3-4]MDJ1115335.1 DNA-binding protein [Microbacterium sp. LX3-4]
MTDSTRRAWATPEQVAEWLQLGKAGTQKLRKMRREGNGPKFVTIGREVRYAWADVHAWCAARRDAPRG